MAAQLQAAGIAVEIDPQSYSNGRFARVHDLREIRSNCGNLQSQPPQASSLNRPERFLDFPWVTSSSERSASKIISDRLSETKQIAYLHEEQLIISIGGVGLIENRWRWNRLIEPQIIESAVVTYIDCGAGV
jgi:hypothetical protein